MPNESGMSSHYNDEVHHIINYVVTNPDKDTRLEKTDLVFVLARSDPGDPEFWDDYNSKNQDVYDILNNKNMAMDKKGKNQGAAEGKGNATGGDGAGQRKNNSNSAFYSGVTSKANQIQVDDGEMQDLKPDIHQTLGSKKIQEEFE